MKLLGWIVIFELATPPWQWRPFVFRGRWAGRPTYRVGWLGVSVSTYRADGLHEFFDHIEATTWRGGSGQGGPPVGTRLSLHGQLWCPEDEMLSAVEGLKNLAQKATRAAERRIHDQGEQIEAFQQTLDEAVVAAGSCGLVPGELPSAIGRIRRERDEALARVAELEEQARRFYAADGSFEVLDSDEEVVARRKAAAVRLSELEGVVSTNIDCVTQAYLSADERASNAEAEQERLRTLLDLASAELLWISEDPDRVRFETFDVMDALEQGGRSDG